MHPRRYDHNVSISYNQERRRNIFTAMRYSEPITFGHSRNLNTYNNMYKTLCVSNIHHGVPNRVIRGRLFYIFNKLNAYTVRIIGELGNRVAYIYFKSLDDAINAMHMMPSVYFNDKKAIITHTTSNTVYHRQYIRSTPRAIHNHNSVFFSCHQNNFMTHIFQKRNQTRLTYREQEELSYGFNPSRYLRLAGLKPYHPHTAIAHREQVFHHRGFVNPTLRGHNHQHNPQYSLRPFKRQSHNEQNNKIQNFYPKNDPLATCILFVENLDISITHTNLYRVFSKHGSIEDIYIKRPSVEYEVKSVYAFVRYQHVDMAFNAKAKLSGQYIGNYKCKIGYAKIIPNQKIWIGGLEPQILLDEIEKEFDRFGVILNIEFHINYACAYIKYECLDAAMEAIRLLRGSKLKGSEQNLKLDYAPNDNIEDIKGDFAINDNYTEEYEYKYFENDGNNSFKQNVVGDLGSSHLPESSFPDQSINSDVKSDDFSFVRTISNLSYNCINVWPKDIILKGSRYTAKCNLISRDPEILELLMEYYL